MANKEYIQRLAKSFRDLHECDAKHVESVAVHEEFHGQTVWRGDVEVFELTGHAKAVRGYAWAFFHGTGGEHERFYAVLQLPPVVTPADAVRAAIASEVVFKPEPGKIYKAMFVTKDKNSTGLATADLIFEDGGKRARLVMEWWPNTGGGDVPKTTIEIDPSHLQKANGREYDFFYPGQVPIPQAEDN